MAGRAAPDSGPVLPVFPGHGSCGGNGGHCCHLGPLGVCPFLRDDGPDAERQFVCTFRERLGSWDAVHQDPEYLETIGPVVMDLVGVYCGDWPRLGEACAQCGVTG